MLIRYCTDSYVQYSHIQSHSCTTVYCTLDRLTYTKYGTITVGVQLEKTIFSLVVPDTDKLSCWSVGASVVNAVRDY